MKTTTPASHNAFDRPRRALPRIAIVVAAHALAFFAFVVGGRVVRTLPPQTVTEVSIVAPQPVAPPPPPTPPLPRFHAPPIETAAPPVRDVEVAPQTEIAATVTDSPTPVEAAGGKPEGTGTAGAGDKGVGVSGGGGPVEVRAIINPDNCVRPRLPRWADERGLAGSVILAIRIDTDGRVSDARVARSSGHKVLDDTALAGARQCRFVAATIDKVPVPSWEAFRFSWNIR